MDKQRMIDILKGRVKYDSPEECQRDLDEIAEYIENIKEDGEEKE